MFWCGNDAGPKGLADDRSTSNFDQNENGESSKKLDRANKGEIRLLQKVAAFGKWNWRTTLTLVATRPTVQDKSDAIRCVTKLGHRRLDMLVGRIYCVYLAPAWSLAARCPALPSSSLTV
ncbi:hypothetical protein DdX_15241 [Ditylenchus destructor]|uniref:Uncharacterized protein n=1 Tax=Ditylenchus destructor TaxID=166010 RepID=A0AAD4R176_9BILA|nr:hypothetical protein DdX_15241 [Ditylenchus destructor]